MFNPLEVLQSQGEVQLTTQLHIKTDDELRGIVKFQSWAHRRELKQLSRAKLILLIVEGTKAKLKQGLTIALLKG